MTPREGSIWVRGPRESIAYNNALFVAVFRARPFPQ